MDENKTCEECGRSLPVNSFRFTRWGGRMKVCRDCVARKRRDTYQANRCLATAEVKPKPISDPSFDHMSIGEVVRLMGRAKKWLESRNCHITLYGDFVETKKKKLKFE